MSDSQNFHTSILSKPIKWNHTSTLRSSDETIQYLKNTPAIWNRRKRKKPYQHCVNNIALLLKSENNGWSWTGRRPGRCQKMFSDLFQSAFCHFNQGNRGKQSTVLWVWAQILINFKIKLWGKNNFSSINPVNHWVYAYKLKIVKILIILSISSFIS